MCLGTTLASKKTYPAVINTEMKHHMAGILEIVTDERQQTSTIQHT